MAGKRDRGRKRCEEAWSRGKEVGRQDIEESKDQRDIHNPGQEGAEKREKGQSRWAEWKVRRDREREGS
jgi:hypothetical protein